MGQVIAVHPGQQLPEYWDGSVLIRGSAPVSPCQSEVIALLQRRWTGEGRLAVFVAGPARHDASGLVDWHDRVFDIADVVMCWWSDDADPRLCPAGPDGQRMVFGAPPHSGYLFTYAAVHGIAAATSLPGMVAAALGKIGSGARRTAGEREVPLSVWRADSFQRWYSAQSSAGNSLLGARQVWTLNAGSHLLYWALQARIFSQALSETEEETGLAVDVQRIRAHGSRQIAATVSAHHAHLFSAEITGDELARLRATQSAPHGAGPTERTWIEIATFGELRRSRLVDWATLGMIIEAVINGA